MGIWILIIAVVLIISSCAVFIVSKRLYSPISSVAESISDNGGNSDGKINVSVIKRAIDSILFERDYYKNWLDISKSSYYDKFFLSLLAPNHMSIEDVKESLEFLQINLSPQNSAVIALFQQYSNDFAKITYKDLEIYDIITEQTAKIFGGNYRYAIVPEQSNSFVIIINCDDTQYDDVFRLLDELWHTVTKYTNVTCGIALSDICSDCSEWPRATEEVRRLINSSYAALEGGILSVRFSNKRLEIIPYPTADMRLLESYILDGNRSAAQGVFDQISSLLTENTGHMSFSTLRGISIRMLNELLDMCASVFDSPSQIVGDESLLYSELINCNDITLILDLFYAIIDNVLAKTESEENNVQSRSDYIDKIKEIIENEYDTSLTLSQIAERLNLSNCYVSRLFKEHMGVTFLTYITEVRMEKAKIMLTQEDKKVVEVSTILGYSNSNYFIRIFKEYTGLTPDKYKKAFKKK